MLKITNKLSPSRNNGNWSASSKNDNSKPAFVRNDGNGEIDRFGDDGVKYAKMSGKSKGQKKFKSWKSAKFKKPSKNGNLPNFDAKNRGPSFLTLKAKAVLNRLQLAFTKALILWHFDPEYYIRIRTDVLSNAIGGVVSQLTSETSSNKVVTKVNLNKLHPIAFIFRKIILIKTCIKSLFLWTTITSVISWIKRAWAPDKSAWPKSSFETISKSIIARIRQMRLQMFCWGFLREARIKKRSSELRIVKSFIACRMYWLVSA